jgi:hypothetical protein
MDRVKKFAADPYTSQEVYNFILAQFLKPVQGDVYIQAASKLAIDALGRAWRELDRLKVQQEKDADVSTNVGL